MRLNLCCASRYFGRAKDLPGVRELFQSRKKEEDEENEVLAFYKKFLNQGPSYFGDLDEDDKELLRQEEAAQQEGSQLLKQTLALSTKLTCSCNRLAAGTSISGRNSGVLGTGRAARDTSPRPTVLYRYHGHGRRSREVEVVRSPGGFVHLILAGRALDGTQNAHTGGDGTDLAEAEETGVGRGVLWRREELTCWNSVVVEPSRAPACTCNALTRCVLYINTTNLPGCYFVSMLWSFVHWQVSSFAPPDLRRSLLKRLPAYACFHEHLEMLRSRAQSVIV